MHVFFLVLARDGRFVKEKIKELESLNVPFLVVCGEQVGLPNVVFREPRGKYDAINFGASLIPKDVGIVALNDVDTKVFNIQNALKYFDSPGVGLVFARVSVTSGPQKSFYSLLDPVRCRLRIAASGELMFVRRQVLMSCVPMKPCKAEDSYILFKTMELHNKAIFCEESFVETERTKTAEMEEDYKRRTVCGIYQALANTRPSIPIKLFYVLLPFMSPLLLILGKKGFFWTKGILSGLSDYIRGDRSGSWIATGSQ
jgi:hypothetical protein